MTERDFEARLQRVLRADADRAVRPFDPVEMAEYARSARAVAGAGTAWRPAGWPLLRTLALVALVLLTGLVTLWLAAGGSQRRPALVVGPTDSPAAITHTPTPVAPTATPAASPVTPATAGLVGTWIAVAPADFDIDGKPVGDRLTLVVDGVGTYAYVPGDGTIERFGSTLSTTPDGILGFVTRPGPGTTAGVGGSVLRACRPAESGTYRWERSADGLLLTLALEQDACPSRSAILARTWVRSLGGASDGGLGVIDAFDPPFLVTMPSGSYTAEPSTDALIVSQAAPEFQLHSWRDPQPFVDPCDPIGKGRQPAADAAAFVAAVREMDGYVVDAVEDATVDGRPAVHLSLHVDPSASCPTGRLAEWQPKAASGDYYWFIRPGDGDSLYLVDLADGFLMFEVLPPPHPLEVQVISSIRLLEGGLPTSP